MSSPFAEEPVHRPQPLPALRDTSDRDAERLRQVLGGCFLVLVALACIGVNLFLPSFLNDLDDSPFVALLLGVCIAQVNLISIWGAMASGRILLRSPWAIALMTIMWYSLVLGNYAERPTLSMDEAVHLGLILYGSLFLGMAPLGIAALLFGWKLERPARDDVREQVSIGLLLGGITLVAVLLGLGRIILPAGAFRWSAMDGQMWLLLAAVVIANLLLTTPAIWISFLPPAILPVASIGMVTYSVVLAVAQIFALSAALGAPPDFIEILVAFSLINVGQVSTVMAVLGCLRLLGFVLRRRGGVFASPGSPFKPASEGESPFQEPSPDVSQLFQGMDN